VKQARNRMYPDYKGSGVFSVCSHSMMLITGLILQAVTNLSALPPKRCECVNETLSVRWRVGVCASAEAAPFVERQGCIPPSWKRTRVTFPAVLGKLVPGMGFPGLKIVWWSTCRRQFPEATPLRIASWRRRILHFESLAQTSTEKGALKDL
jgi:hypothetical protein